MIAAREDRGQSPADFCRDPTQRQGGFTLIELLVVIALIAGLAAFLIGSMGGGQAASLESAQATLVNAITAARTRAMASGCRVRLLINANPNSPERFRRMIAVQEETAYKSNSWLDPSLVISIPAGVYVLPQKNQIPTGLFETPGDWTKQNTASADHQLHSSALYTAQVPATVLSATSEMWDLIQFTPDGTMSFGLGDLVLALGTLRPPGSFAAGESPVRADSPDKVRGLSLSTYGVPALINSRAGF